MSTDEPPAKHGRRSRCIAIYIFTLCTFLQKAEKFLRNGHMIEMVCMDRTMFRIEVVNLMGPFKYVFRNCIIPREEGYVNRTDEQLVWDTEIALGHSPDLFFLTC